ncbi:ABC transporter ATP-binding protein [Sporosarcina sp. NCCP-2716]|uniref:ABC transporter ATP-binding protein n=1 Tax=Sporosarcina sp. NCCP-2716 TaxID=2943679 RepID=UPI002041D479|nr:ABC transporter ATP-binding protein [Sporosarcina sp. NCCP-2716]GKV68540.1 ABC transporter ATP-binding protein [Sporosarcina sp. NCCP-2716]
MVIQIAKAQISYGDNLPILKDINLTVNKNDWIIILGVSGTGKTSLLNMVGGLLRPDAGDVVVGGRNLQALKSEEMQEYRRNTIGFIYQDFKLFEQYTVLENVMLPRLPYDSRKKLEKQAIQLLESVGLSHRLSHLPAELSGGEKQRVAIARALIGSPEILLCDEPTGNLDSESTKTVMNILQKLHTVGLTILLITHDDSLSPYGNRILTTGDGTIVELEDQ